MQLSDPTRTDHQQNNPENHQSQHAQCQELRIAAHDAVEHTRVLNGCGFRGKLRQDQRKRGSGGLGWFGGQDLRRRVGRAGGLTEVYFSSLADEQDVPGLDEGIGGQVVFCQKFVQRDAVHLSDRDQELPFQHRVADSAIQSGRGGLGVKLHRQGGDCCRLLLHLGGCFLWGRIRKGRAENAEEQAAGNECREDVLERVFIHE